MSDPDENVYELENGHVPQDDDGTYEDDTSSVPGKLIKENRVRSEFLSVVFIVSFRLFCQIFQQQQFLVRCCCFYCQFSFVFNIVQVCREQDNCPKGACPKKYKCSVCLK